MIADAAEKILKYGAVYKNSLQEIQATKSNITKDQRILDELQDQVAALEETINRSETKLFEMESSRDEMNFMIMDILIDMAYWDDDSLPEFFRKNLETKITEIQKLSRELSDVQGDYISASKKLLIDPDTPAHEFSAAVEKKQLSLGPIERLIAAKQAEVDGCVLSAIDSVRSVLPLLR